MIRPAAVIAALALAGIGCGGPEGTERATGGSGGAVAVHVADLVRMDLSRRVVAYGTVEPEPATPQRPAAAASVSAVISGIVTAVRCAEGQRVERGALLFELDPRSADQAIRQAEQALAFAEKEVDRQKTMRPGEGTSIRRYQEAQRDLDAARTELALRQTQRSYLDVVSPLDGMVLRVLSRVGETAEPGVALAEVADLDRLVAIVHVPERERAGLQPGQPVELAGAGATPAAATGVETDAGVRPGELRFVGSRVDPRDGTVEAWARFPAAAGLLPGQFVEVRIVTERRADRLAAPREAVMPDAAGHASVVVVHDGRARRVPVTTGMVDGDWVEVEGAGLSADSVVVTSGGYGLIDGDEVSVLGRPPTTPGAEPD